MATMESGKIEREWARSQAEAMADGTLDPQDRERMERVLASDPASRTAVDDAREVFLALRAMQLPAPPTGLLRRLLVQAPGRSRPARRPSFFRQGAVAAGTGVAATAVITWLFATLAIRTPDPAEQTAVRDFAIAMSYLRRTAVTTRDEVGQQLGQGFVSALQISRNTLSGDDAAGETNGG